MPEYLAPGVYVEEVRSQKRPIEGVPTRTTGFIGPCHKGPIKRATLVTNLADSERTYGSCRRLWIDGGTFCPDYTWHAVRAFFMATRQPAWAQADIDQGRLICVAGVAVVRPAEFVTFRIGQWTADRR